MMFMWFKFATVVCAVVLLLGLLADVILYTAAMTFGGVTI
jgi:hypothetical protein